MITCRTGPVTQGYLDWRLTLGSVIRVLTWMHPTGHPPYNPTGAARRVHPDRLSSPGDNGDTGEAREGSLEHLARSRVLRARAAESSGEAFLQCWDALGMGTA
jgi:hypothetical protein